MRRLADPPVDPDAARRRAAEILARREFAPARRNPLTRALDAVGRFLGRILARLFGAFGGGGGSGATVAAWLVVAVVAGVLIVLLVRGWRNRSVPAADEDATIVAVIPTPGGDEWRRRAAEHAAAGRWGEAVRCRYRAVEADLADRGVLGGVPGDTTGAERRQVASGLPEAAPGFGAAADVFDGVAYGAADAGPETLAALDALDAELGRR